MTFCHFVDFQLRCSAAVLDLCNRLALSYSCWAILYENVTYEGVCGRRSLSNLVLNENVEILYWVWFGPKQITVNPEYFVCILFSYFSYAAASVQKYNAYEKVQTKSENLPWSAAVRKFHAYERSEFPNIRKFSVYEVFWIYSMNQ